MNLNFINNGLREIFVRPARKGKIEDSRLTILSNNCLAGFLYHDYSMQFQSPTINLQMSPEDFIRFCADLKRYMALKIQPAENPDAAGFARLGGEKIDFPVGLLDDLTLYFQHYRDFEEAAEKWEERKKRICWERIFVILLVNECDRELAERFESLPFSNKLLLYASTASAADLWQDNAILMKGLAESGKAWYDYCRTGSARRFYEQIDYAVWFNRRVLQKTNGRNYAE